MKKIKISLAQNIICLILGHNWKYNLIYWIGEASNNHYEYTDKRQCKRCTKKQWTILPLKANIWKDMR